MPDGLKLTRRGLIKAGGYLALGFTLAGPIGRVALAQDDPRPPELRNNPRLSSWIRINADGTATLLTGKVELGQGIETAFAQIAADELDISLERLSVVAGNTWLGPNQGTTAGSNSTQYGAWAVHYAAAEVRQILLELAAEQLGQPVDQLTVEDGTITAQAGGQTTYWELVSGQELEREATGNVTLKPADQYRYIGQSVIRFDIPPKMTGEPIFVHDHRPEGMLHARVVRPPTYKARLTGVDLTAAESMPGVVAVVRNGSFLGVIAERDDQLGPAADALAASASWEVESDLPGHEGIYDWMLQQPTRDVEDKNVERTEGGEPARVVEATYRRPYQMHASIGTSAAVATLGEDGVVTIQTHSQSVFDTARAIAGMLGLEQNQVRCEHMQGSGCYGHNMADDAAADAALLAMAVPGRPVRLQYTREQEHRWEPYGSAMLIQTRAGLDADGNVLDWNLEIWSTPHGTRPGGNPGNLLSARYLETPFEQPVPGPGGPPNYSGSRNGIALYEFPGHRVMHHSIAAMPLRVSSTRGLGAYGNVFAIESFIDELAHEAGADPVEYRLRFLQDERARDVLVRAADLFGWDSWQPGNGRGRGIAFAQYKNLGAYCAVALEVEVTRRNGRVRVTRAVTTADAGQAISPDGLANQIEGGVIQSLSWTLKEEVKFDSTRVLSEDWASYPILTFSETPPIEVEIINRPGMPYLGAGEASQGPTGAAVANAVFDATGVRFRHLPLTPDRVREGLAS